MYCISDVLKIGILEDREPLSESATFLLIFYVITGCRVSWFFFFTYLQVTILFANFSADENLTDEGRQSARDINEYNRRYSGEPRPVSG